MEKVRFGPITITNGYLIKIYRYVNDRLDIKEFLDLEVFDKIAPTNMGLLSCFGGITFFLFLTQIVTGLLLMIYYIPETGKAYDSVVMITNSINFGWAVRGMHAWGANLMVITVVIHMAKIFFSGIYKPPRELNWVNGMVLFLLTLSFAFTGYLLPWAQLSYWATVVGTETPTAIPVVGHLIEDMMRGGNDVSQITLSRFFAIHVMVLPITMAAFLVLHFFQIRRQGIAGPI